MRKIILAGGCFWGVQEYFSRIEGVINTQVGYVNGTFGNPIYEEICAGKADFAEAVFIEYDEEKLTLEKLLEKFWAIIDPTTLYKQGNDRGVQYRTGIYYEDEKDVDVIEISLNEEQNKYTRKIVTEVEKIQNYFDAEKNHQDYLKKNPNGYCHIKLD